MPIKLNVKFSEVRNTSIFLLNISEKKDKVILTTFMWDE